MELLQGRKKGKPDYASLYLNAAIRSSERMKEAPEDRQAKLRSIFYGVKLIVSTMSEQVNESEARFWMIEAIKAHMKELTPRDLMQMFPIDKRYNGHKYGCKDYFSTMAALYEHGLDKPLGDAVDRILWDYMNHETMEFVVAGMSALNAIRRRNGSKDLFEEFFGRQGVKLQTYTMSTDEKGRRWLTDTDTGERQRVRVKRPRYLKVV